MVQKKPATDVAGNCNILYPPAIQARRSKTGKRGEPEKGVKPQ